MRPHLTLQYYLILYYAMVGPKPMPRRLIVRVVSARIRDYRLCGHLFRDHRFHYYRLCDDRLRSDKVAPPPRRVDAAPGSSSIVYSSSLPSFSAPWPGGRPLALEDSPYAGILLLLVCRCLVLILD